MISPVDHSSRLHQAHFEPAGFAPRRFSRADTDGDGAIGPTEFKAALKESRDSQRHRPDQSAERPSTGPATWFKKLDADADGQVSAEELQTRFEAWRAEHPGGRMPVDAPTPDFSRFVARLDENQDGGISESEFAASWQRWSARRHPRADHGGTCLEGGTPAPEASAPTLDAQV